MAKRGPNANLLVLNMDLFWLVYLIYIHWYECELFNKSLIEYKPVVEFNLFNNQCELSKKEP